MIRKWKIPDYEGVAGLFLQVHQLHQENRPDFFRTTNNPFTKESFLEILDNKNAIALLAEANGKIAGFSLVTLKFPSDTPLLLPRKVAYMEDLAVHEEFRKKGIGKLLFNSVKAEARKLGYEKLELMVWNFNESAIQFYKKIGMAERSIIMETDL